jgi:tol-pal system protein YbgF
MLSNIKRVVSLSLLASAANIAFAAPAPVSDLNAESTPQAATTVSSSQSISESQVQRLERLLKNSNRVQVNLQQQVDDLSLELSDMRGELERSNYEMNQLVQRQRELFKELDRVRSDVAKANSQQANSEAQTEANSVTTSAPTETESASYKAAYALVAANEDSEAAIAALTKFKTDFPNSTYVSNADYWIGQLLYNENKNIEAAKQFSLVISNESSPKRADSLVKLGIIAERIGRPEVAIKYWNQVIEEYPNDSSATKAKQSLEKAASQ